MQPLIVDMPYPSLSGIEKNPKYVKLIEQAYAGRHGELTAILQYVYQSVYFKKEGKDGTADKIMQIAVAEMKHLKILASLILVLGKDPIYATTGFFGPSFFDASFVSYCKSPKKMLIDDLSDELIAIDFYKSAAEDIKDEKVAAVLKRIMLDEELHAVILKEEISACKD